jgi:hypothetical protein
LGFLLKVSSRRDERVRSTSTIVVAGGRWNVILMMEMGAGRAEWLQAVRRKRGRRA